MNPQSLREGAALLLVLVAAIWDWRTRRIPNRLVLAGLVGAALLHSWNGGLAAVLSPGLSGGATGLLLFLPLYRMRGMAAGDVKLMAAVGAFEGPLLAFQIALAACCFGGLMGLGLALWRGRLSQLVANLHGLGLRLFGYGGAALDPAASVGSMPYGLAIAAGTTFIIGLRHAF